MNNYYSFIKKYTLEDDYFSLLLRVMSMKKKIISIISLIALVSAFGIQVIATSQVNGGSVELRGQPEITPYTTELVDDGLGEWRYGTGVGWEGGVVKTVYSDLDHSTKEHRSSCSIGNNYDDSGWFQPRRTSTSSTWGPLTSTAYANWDTK